MFGSRNNISNDIKSEDSRKDQPAPIAGTTAVSSVKGPSASSSTESQKEMDQRTEEMDVLNLAISGLGLASKHAQQNQDLFLGCYNSYEARLRGYDQRYGDTSSNNPNPYLLTTADWAVLLNSLFAARQAINSIRMYFTEMIPQSTTDHDHSSHYQLVSTIVGGGGACKGREGVRHVV